jgi:hypothetical protein
VDGVSFDYGCSVTGVEINSMVFAHQHDPDPSDDEVIDEPANDWPVAEDNRSVD